MMCMGDKYAAICLDCIDDISERENVRTKLRETGKEIIELTEEQIHQFAGNMLQIKSADGEPLLILSNSACKALSQEQINSLSS